MADIPFLGCKISLISKCDIRYEGILYCVDPKESTISLSKVRSYGTETRGDPANFVPPKNDVYDVIIFRASDVKDLRVNAPEPPGLSDPAIISARQSSNSTFDANPEGSPPTSSGPSSHQQQQQQSHQGHQQQQKPLLPFLPTGSGKNQQQSQQSQPVVNYSSAVTSNAQRRARPDSRNQKSDNEMNNRKSEVSSGRDAAPRRGPPRGDGDGGDRRSDRRDNDRRDDRRGGAGGRVSNDRRDYNNQHQQNHDGGRRGDSRPQPRMNRGGYERNYVNNNSRYNNGARDRRGPSHRDDDSKGGPMNRRRGPMPGGRRGRSGDRAGAPRPPRKSAPLKFEGEYDFDEANKLFMQLEGKMKNLKLKDGQKDETNGGGESSGDRANSKSPTGQSESGSGYDSDDHNHKDLDSKDGGFGGSVSGEYYDKSKSFFDNISCEASDRVQGKMGKPDWRKERQTNAETFGISANYRSRGGYRGRSYGANGYHRR